GSLPLSEGPLAAEIYIALLCVLVDWSPGPPGLRGEHLQRPGIGHEPKVADRSAHLVARRDGVVDHEDLEDRRHAAPEPYGPLEERHGYGLHPRDPGVVDMTERDGPHAASDQRLRQRPGPIGTPGDPFSRSR